jgi:hypothetical protein
LLYLKTPAATSYRSIRSRETAQHGHVAHSFAVGLLPLETVFEMLYGYI